MLFAPVVTVMLVLDESMQPLESLTKSLTTLVPGCRRNRETLDFPTMVSFARVLSTFHQYLTILLPLPVEVFVALTMVGNPQVCEVLLVKEGVILQA